MSHRSDVRDLLKKAERAGCVVTMRKCGHYKIVTPERRTVFCSQTPSDHQALYNIARDLRRAGVNV